MRAELVLLDLDYTLLHTDKSISERSLDALEKCKARGIVVAIATARAEGDATRFIEAVGPDTVISCGGAMVRLRGDIVYFRTMDAETVDCLLMAAVDHPGIGGITVEFDDGYFRNDIKDLRDWSFRGAKPYDFRVPRGKPAVKVTLELKDRAAMEDLHRIVPQTRVVPFSDIPWARFCHPEATKGEAMKALAGALGVPLQLVAAFGDDIMDMEMLRDAGIGVAMANAVPLVLHTAAYVTGTNDEDGVASFIERNLLCDT